MTDKLPPCYHPPIPSRKGQFREGLGEKMAELKTISTSRKTFSLMLILLVNKNEVRFPLVDFFLYDVLAFYWPFVCIVISLLECVKVDHSMIFVVEILSILYNFLVGFFMTYI